jgi:NTP pyrophosphatase (non-canonical NTP hydrolase)
MMVDFSISDTLTIRDLQAFHQELDTEKDFDRDLFRNLAYLMAELGETVRAARQLERARGLPEEDEARDHLGEELADCLAYVLKLANYADIDLQACYTKKMKQNLRRTWSKKPHGTEQGAG